MTNFSCRQRAWTLAAKDWSSWSYLTGERTPYPDPNARGAFVGLTVRHGADHMTRAVLEGVAFGLRDSMELLARDQR